MACSTRASTKKSLPTKRTPHVTSTTSFWAYTSPPGNVHDNVAFDPLYDYLCQYYPEHKIVAADSAYKTPWICKRIFESGRVLTSAYTRPKTKAGNHPWHTPMYRDIYKLRKEKIERVFAYAKEKYGMRYTQYRGLTQVTNWVKLKAIPHNSSAALAMSFPPSASCKFLDLHPVNLRNLHLHLTKNPFASRPPHLCGVTLISGSYTSVHIAASSGVSGFSSAPYAYAICSVM